MRGAGLRRRRSARRTIVCPCHDVTLLDLQDCHAAGFTHPETVKRITALLMGPCQGKHCASVALEVLDALEGPPSGALQRPTARPPLFCVRLGELAADCEPSGGGS